MNFTKKRGVKLAACLICICVLVFNSINIAISTLGLREQFNWMPIALSEVTSDSMSPMFETGDMLVLIERPYEELEEGDVVAFHQGDQLVTHQIVGTSSGQFITQGIANSKVDTTLMGQEEYCATLYLIVPNFGSVLEFFSGAWEIGCLLLFVIVALYGKVFLEWIFAQKAQDTEVRTHKKVQLKSKMRLLVTVTCMSVILLTPSLTTAKYVAQINDYTMLSAGSLNFTSNYLSTDGNSYSVSGWQGGDYAFVLEIRGYSNDLLYNGNGNDVEYGLYIVPITTDEIVVEEDENSDVMAVEENENSDDPVVEEIEDADDIVTSANTYGILNTDYTLTVSVESGLSPLGDAATYTFPTDMDGDLCYGPYKLSGNDGNKTKHSFTITVTGTEELAVGEQIRFEIWAETSHEGQFYMTQMGDFLFTKASADDFISGSTKDTTGNLITYTVKSNELEQESTSKEVTFYWNTDKLYLNEFESSAYQIIVSQSDDDPDYDKTEGWLKVIMKDYTSVSLQFFIRSGFEDEIEDGDLWFVVEGETLEDAENTDEPQIETEIETETDPETDPGTDPETGTDS